MIKELKTQFLKDPEKIRSLLEEFDFYNINIRGNNIRFARDENGGQNINIHLDDEFLNVTDYARSEHADIISYIMKEKGTDFKTVLNIIKKILNLSNDWVPSTNRAIFGGVYNNIIHKTYIQPKIYDESILDSYLKIPNTRFQRDNIDLRTQMEWGIGYDVETNRITFPIRNQYGELIGVKGRRNYETKDENDPKYLYLYNCQMSKTLYGYSENYNYLYGNQIFVGESEKFTLQLASMGYRNSVSLGSNSLSEYQAKLLLSLNPRIVIFMLDNDLPLENTKRNIEVLQSACTMRDLKISYFDWTNCLDLPNKASPSDEGKETLINILENYVVDASSLFPTNNTIKVN